MPLFILPREKFETNVDNEINCNYPIVMGCHATYPVKVENTIMIDNDLSRSFCESLEAFKSRVIHYIQAQVFVNFLPLYTFFFITSPT